MSAPSPEAMSNRVLAAIADGQLERLKGLLKQQESNTVPESNISLDQITAEAVRHNQPSIVQWCIDAGAKITHPVITALLHENTWESFQLLVSSGGLNINHDLEWLGSFLILEVEHADLARASWCLEHGADPNLGSLSQVWSPLATAVQFGASTEMIDLLLSNGARLDESDALVTAAECGRVDMVKHLLDRGAKIDEVGFRYCLGDGSRRENAGSALHSAVAGGHADIVTFLLDQGADVNLKDDKERTPLARAKESSNETIIAILQQHGATM